LLLTLALTPSPLTSLLLLEVGVVVVVMVLSVQVGAVQVVIARTTHHLALRPHLNFLVVAGL
jgi:hypothetical protein